MFSFKRALCLLAGAALFADALFLLALRVFSLGATLPLALGAALLVLGTRWDAIHRWLGATHRRGLVWRCLWIAFWIWVTTVAAFWVALARAASDVEGAPPAAIVVLGSGTPGGKVSPVLAARLDLALERARTYPQAKVVVSGGLGFNEVRSEAEVMGDYLRDHALAAARITQEQRSTSTDENLRFSRPMLERLGVAPARDRIEIVTSDFHTLRSGWIARHAGYANVRMAAAPTPLYARYNAWLREYFAAIVGWLLGDF